MQHVEMPDIIDSGNTIENKTVNLTKGERTQMKNRRKRKEKGRKRKKEQEIEM
jgi:hypothetical protein